MSIEGRCSKVLLDFLLAYPISHLAPVFAHTGDLARRTFAVEPFGSHLSGRLELDPLDRRSHCDVEDC